MVDVAVAELAAVVEAVEEPDILDVVVVVAAVDLAVVVAVLVAAAVLAGMGDLGSAAL